MVVRRTTGENYKTRKKIIIKKNRKYKVIVGLGRARTIAAETSRTTSPSASRRRSHRRRRRCRRRRRRCRLHTFCRRSGYALHYDAGGDFTCPLSRILLNRRRRRRTITFSRQINVRRTTTHVLKRKTKEFLLFIILAETTTKHVSRHTQTFA